MSYDHVGKAAKRKGVMRFNHVRKLDPVPEKRPPGVAKPHRKVEKPFGYSYEMGIFSRSWRRYFQWFETEAARDQSMRALGKKIAGRDWCRDLRAERRGAEHG
jgi:hypothetical protein